VRRVGRVHCKCKGSPLLLPPPLPPPPPPPTFRVLDSHKLSQTTPACPQSRYRRTLRTGVASKQGERDPTHDCQPKLKVSKTNLIALHIPLSPHFLMESLSGGASPTPGSQVTSSNLSSLALASITSHQHSRSPLALHSAQASSPQHSAHISTSHGCTRWQGHL
jgi:hypothetical protein